MESLKDLSHQITNDCKVRIITSNDKEGLEVIRHDAAHIMAMAVQELFNDTQVTIGPVIENGFYYDFARKEPFTNDDLKKIEKKMSEIIDRDVKTKREVWQRNEAIAHFKKLEKNIKLKLLKVFLKMRNSQSITMETLGMIYAEDLILLLLGKLGKLLN